jgi:hypothetical protein
MRYALLIYCDDETAASDPERERREEQLTAILDRLRAHGVLAGTQRLLPARAARIVDGYARPVNVRLHGKHELQQ